MAVGMVSREGTVKPGRVDRPPRAPPEFFRSTAAVGVMLPFRSYRWNWQKLFSYGEVVCFISAWAVGLLMALNEQPRPADPTPARTFAVSSEVHGPQATLVKR